MNRGKCRGCDREIFWAKTDAGKNIPLDRLSNLYTQDLTPVGWRARSIQPVDENGNNLELYISHFLTCPKANQFSIKATEPKAQGSFEI